VSASGLSTIFITRTHYFSWQVWKERPGFYPLIAYVFAQTVATFLVNFHSSVVANFTPFGCLSHLAIQGAYGLGDFPHDGLTDFGGAGWGYVLVCWVWVLLWYALASPGISMGSNGGRTWSGSLLWTFLSYWLGMF